MTKPKVIIVMLRRPRKNNPNERRDDPFWEFGSFGCTGCHDRTLVHRAKAGEAEGARLAFGQGGQGGIRLAHLTPPVQIVDHGYRCEAHWKPRDMPFRYAEARVLIDNAGHTDFPALKPLLCGVVGATCEGRFASAFRSRRKPLEPNVAAEVIGTYTAMRAGAEARAIASTYVQALPSPPPKVDRHRRRTHARFLREAAGAPRARCSRGRTRQPSRSVRLTRTPAVDSGR